VASLRERIQNGSYQPDLELLAERIIDDELARSRS